MTALIIGSTGLVGGELLQQLLDNPTYKKITCLVRKPVAINHAKLEQVMFDFDNPDAAKVSADHIYCTIGTTLAKAGSKENQFKIDCTYPSVIATIGKQNGATGFALVSSVGADADSSNFYLATKGKLEQHINHLQFPHFVCVRPSFILGKRSESRLGEKIAIGIASLLNPLLFGPFRKYKSVQASDIANSMIVNLNSTFKALQIIQSPEIQ